MAFFNAATSYGSKAAEALVEYHKKHGGVSRYRKFEHFLQNIVRVDPDEFRLNCLLENFAREVRKGLLSCGTSPCLASLRTATTASRWIVVSGGDQEELRDVFACRELAQYFDGGIFGSPDNKETILSRELANSNIKLPAVYIGDSRYDYEVASRAGMDFIFVSNWTEFSEWKLYQQRTFFMAVPDLCSLLN